MFNFIALFAYTVMCTLIWAFLVFVVFKRAEFSIRERWLLGSMMVGLFVYGLFQTVQAWHHWM